MGGDHLFSEFRIKNRTFKNRLGVAPMTRMSSGPDGIPRKDVLEFLVRRAQNGAVAAGFDGVELHCAHGYLLNQFLSSYSNQRQDNYGGSIENRFQYIHDAIGAVRKTIPLDRLFFARISNWGIADMEVSLFKDKSEWQNMIRLFSREAIDAISVSTYDHQQKAFSTDQTMAQITREATHLPVLTCGKIHDQASAQDALKNADIVLSAKTALLNPNWVEGFRSGKVLPTRAAEEANIAYTETPLL